MTPAFSPWLNTLLDGALFVMLLSLLLVAWRLWRGPDAVDRLLALDTLYLNAASLLLVWDLRHPMPLLFEAALMITALGFVGTTAAARYLARHAVIE
ncbi:monovalent cation/H+ antiporter complex subunit F [Hydrogenophilus thiooxidans]|uniref:monovalent cation/H+ antiporter complex subunit F n=1 Tax=Hydrogenophilus thiooxidans TaxID=2820326 RepID=UPI001C239AE2|nr:monovalent cation/H+ antiporter complex subunit F [Hydrogenophilus thiooxidans]